MLQMKCTKRVQYAGKQREVGDVFEVANARDATLLKAVKSAVPHSSASPQPLRSTYRTAAVRLPPHKMPEPDEPTPPAEAPPKEDPLLAMPKTDEDSYVPGKRTGYKRRDLKAED